MIISRWSFLIMRNISDRICRVIQNTHFKSNNFISESFAVYEIKGEKYGRARQATDNNMALAHCMLGN